MFNRVNSTTVHPSVWPAAKTPRVSLQRIRRLDAADVVASFIQEEADYLFGFGVFAFAEVAEAEVAIKVEHVLGGPVSVCEVAPGGVVVVLDDEPADVVLFGRASQTVDFFFVLEFGGVHP